MKLNQKTETSKKTLYTGYDSAEILSVNPDKIEIIKLLNIDAENEDKVNEPNYLSEKDGNPTVRLDFWVKSGKSKNIDKLTFFLEQKERTNKDGSKFQFCNQLGVFQWADDESNLFSSFSNFEQIKSWIKDGNVTEKYVKGAKPNETEVHAKKSYRKAFSGEEQLYEFLKSWLVGIDYRDDSTDILLDTKKLFSGNFKELQSLVGSDNVGSVVLCYSVKTVEKDGNVNDYQSISNSYFLQGANQKLLRNQKFDQESLQALATKVEAKNGSNIEKFIFNSALSEYKIKDFFVPGDLQEYNENLNLVSLSNSGVIENNDSSY